MFKRSKFIATLTIIFSILGIGFLILWITPNIDIVTRTFSQHKILGPFFLIFWRILAIVIPPIPGGFVGYALLPVFGWKLSFVYNSLGVLIGTSTAFWLARLFREPLVKKFIPLQKLHEWEGKLSNKKEFLAFLGIRLSTSPVLDFISYVAGLSKISFGNFFLATLVSILPEVLIYYVGDKAYKISVYFGVALVIIFLIFFYVFKKKEFLEADKK